MFSNFAQVIIATFAGDYKGNWETNAKFNYNSSIFALDFNGSAINNREYSEAIVRFETRLNKLGQMGK